MRTPHLPGEVPPLVNFAALLSRLLRFTFQYLRNNMHLTQGFAARCICTNVVSRHTLTEGTPAPQSRPVWPSHCGGTFTVLCGSSLPRLTRSGSEDNTPLDR